MSVYYARTPTRIDLAGGWTDVPRFAEEVPGAVVNFAINLYSYVTLREGSPSTEANGRARAGQEAPIGRKIAPPDERISMYSVDFGEREEVPSLRDIQNVELTGNFGLVKAALRRRISSQPSPYTGRARVGLDIFTRSDAPPGSGLGTSASMGVALIGALNLLTDTVQTPDQVAETAFELETVELGILSGKQDHYGAALGGVSFMTFRGGFVQSVPLPMSLHTYADLQRRTVLVYTGKSRLSSDLHRHVVQKFESRDAQFFQFLERLAQIARDVRDALLRSELDDVGKLIHANWQYQKELYHGISTPEIEHLCAVGMEQGAIGVKACGAGGGGCLVFVCRDGAEGNVAKALKAAGAEVLRFDLAMHGLMAWSREG